MIKVSIKNNQPVNVETITENRVGVKATGEVLLQDSSGYGNYTGEYEVESGFIDKILLTEKKKLEKDIKVKAMPVAEVSNVAGGKTIMIG